MDLIVINAISALRGGGQTYLLNLLDNLPNKNIDILLLVNTKNKSIFLSYDQKQVKLFEASFASKSLIHRVIWETFFLPAKLKAWQAATYYAPGGMMTTLVPKGCISVTALQNMLPFDDRERKRYPLFSYQRLRLWLLRDLYLISYRLSDKIIFISEYSKSVIQQHIPSVENKSTVIPHGLCSRFLNTSMTYALPENLKDTPFYLYVSILDAYKAQNELVRTWKLLSDHGFPYPLVLVGPTYAQYGDEVLALINNLQLSKKVLYLGAVEYEQLPGLYRAARALIFASSCECCPNILLEKLASEKPVFCSNIQPMPEFGGDAVVYFDPYDKMDLFEKINDIESQPAVMDTLAHQAYQQALKFDWKSTAQKTINFLLNSQKGSNDRV